VHEHEEPMSYKSRERKRRAKAAMGSAVAKQREAYADRHYLTIVKRPACCNTCGRSLRNGSECVFRTRPMEILCKGCADERRIPYRTSRRC
jgi:RNase P subunit RPR2